MRNLLVFGMLLLNFSGFGQYDRIDRADTSIHIVEDYWYFNQMVLYPQTSAVYEQPCIYRIVPPDSSQIEIEKGFLDYSEQYKLVKKQGKFGAIKAWDTLMIPMIYDSLIPITDAYPMVFIAKLGNKYGLISKLNEVLIPFEFDQIQLLSNGPYGVLMHCSLQVEKQGKKGLMRVDGSVELSCNYDYIDTYCWQTDCPKKGIQYYVKKEGGFGYVNRDETIAIPLKYEALDASDFSGLIKAKNGGKVGLMDTLGNFIVPQVYEELFSEFHWSFHQLTAFKQEGKWGLMYGDYGNQKIIVDNVYDSVMTAPGFDDHFIVINNNKWGLADTMGKVVIAPQFDELKAMEDGNFAYKLKGKWGFVSDKGMVRCSPRYDEITDNLENWCLVMRDNGYGFCKTSGEQIIDPVYQAPYWDDYLNWGNLVEKGHIALSKLRADGDFDCKMGVIDSTGKVLLPFEYDCQDNLVYGFGNVLIAVRNNKEVIIDKNGKELALGDYDGFEQMRYDYGYFFPKKGDKIGLVSPEGKVISLPKYTNIEVLDIGGEGLETKRYFLVKIGSKFGLLDSNGTQILAPEYEALSIKHNDKVEIVSGNQVKIYNLTTGKYESFSAGNDYQFNGQVGVFRGANSKAFFIDKNGRRINDLDYQEIWLIDPQSTYFSVHKNGLVGICDSTGKEIFEPKFSKIKYWDGTFGAGKLNDLYCFFDGKGDTLVGYRYEKVKDIYKDFLCVKINNKFGVVNKKGETLVPAIYRNELNFDYLAKFGLIPVNLENKFGVLNANFELILAHSYNQVYLVKVHDKVYILASYAGGILLFDDTGEKVSSDTFTTWEQTNSGELFLFQDSKKFVLNERGEVIVDTTGPE